MASAEKDNKTIVPREVFKLASIPSAADLLNQQEKAKEEAARIRRNRIERKIFTGEAWRNNPTVKSYMGMLNQFNARKRDLNKSSEDELREAIDLYIMWKERLNEMVEMLEDDYNLYDKLKNKVAIDQSAKLKEWIREQMTFEDHNGYALTNEAVATIIRTQISALHPPVDATAGKYQSEFNAILKGYFNGRIDYKELEELLYGMLDDDNVGPYVNEIEGIPPQLKAEKDTLENAIYEHINKLLEDNLSKDVFWRDLKTRKDYYIWSNAEIAKHLNVVDNEQIQQAINFVNKKNSERALAQQAIKAKIGAFMVKLMSAAEDPVDYIQRKLIKDNLLVEVEYGGGAIKGLNELGELAIPKSTNIKPIKIYKSNVVRDMIKRGLRKATNLNDDKLCREYAASKAKISPFSMGCIYEKWEKAIKARKGALAGIQPVKGVKDQEVEALLEFAECIVEDDGVDYDFNAKVDQIKSYIENKEFGQDTLNQAAKTINIGALAIGQKAAEDFARKYVEKRDKLGKAEYLYRKIAKPIKTVTEFVLAIKGWVKDKDKMLAEDKEVDIKADWEESMENTKSAIFMIGDNATAIAGAPFSVYSFGKSYAKASRALQLWKSAREHKASIQAKLDANDVPNGPQLTERLKVLKLAVRNELRKFVASIVGLLKSIVSVLSAIFTVIGVTAPLAVALETVKTTITLVEISYKTGRAIYKYSKGIKGKARNEAADQMVKDAFIGEDYAIDFLLTAGIFEGTVLHLMSFDDKTEFIRPATMKAKLQAVNANRNGGNQVFNQLSTKLQAAVFYHLASW